ncbi:hypothetical protein [Actinomadura decatromicini]|uniref:Uncharacterized protein n=1 Tax=Actinomadura decatromicini TaxID=2604572 RepID=A0A5D3FA91_9ACTN|nr:hypothetical protein [Actinomadura decatromicini]TYK44610.1 hypothetical protein FXF68_34765 [Actinomadura decatromicini]
MGLIVSAATGGALAGTALAPFAADRFPLPRLVAGATAITGCLVLATAAASDRIVATGVLLDRLSGGASVLVFAGLLGAVVLLSARSGVRASGGAA